MRGIRVVLAGIALGGCSRDGQQAVDANPSPDAEVDAPFVECPLNLNRPDGGEIRIENLIYPDGSARTLTTAYFLKAQAGDPLPQPFPNVADNDVLVCNTFADRIYPFGDASDTLGAPATYGVDREYMDVGARITLHASSDATSAFDLHRYQDFITPFLGGSFHEITYNPDVAIGDPMRAIPAALLGGAGENVDGHRLTVTLPGGPDLAEPQVFDFEGGQSGVQIPPRPVVSDFAMLDVGSAMTIQRSEAFTRSWTVPPQAPTDLLSYVAVFDTTGDGEPYLVKLCVSAKPGKITMRPTDLATMPAEGMLFVAHLLHRTRDKCVEPHSRRIDMVGVAATATAFTMVP